MMPRLDLTRAQILAFRRHAGCARSSGSRADAARSGARRGPGLQDSMPRAALLSIHARVEGTEPSTWEDPSLVQLWGPRYHVYVVADARSAGLHAREAAGQLARPGGRRTISPPASMRRLAGGRDAVRRGGTGARRPRKQPPLRRADRHRRDQVGGRSAADRLDGACARDRARRRRPSSLRAGTCTSSVPRRPDAFAEWAGIARRRGAEAFDALGGSLTAVRTPVGDAWILARDEPTFRAAPGSVAPARLLPSGDAYFLFGCRPRTPGP